MGFFLRAIFIVGFLFSGLTARSSWVKNEKPTQLNSADVSSKSISIPDTF